MTSKGGARDGAGRRKTGRKYLGVRLSQQEINTFKKLGGSRWLQNVLQEKMKNEKLRDF